MDIHLSSRELLQPLSDQTKISSVGGSCEKKAPPEKDESAGMPQTDNEAVTVCVSAAKTATGGFTCNKKVHKTSGGI